ncbi:exosome complex component RRP45 [Diachasma alloeum]|uniref:exosome complex component RRP45 n=1 Tax=Diachasma alloeum TaxID=454923 RepID=UPI0007385129|nr:exosome complex component RRP45 [Diachasma alloeum]
MREIPLSKCEREFINSSVEQGIRLDGRQLLEGRKVKLHFGGTWGRCLAALGQTQVIANVSCDVQPPKVSRPNEGMVHINVELTPLAAPYFEAGRQSEAGVLLTRQLEKCFKDSRCIDLESLCIVADKKVWNLRVDINVINHDGNLVDCASIAALAALLHFHRPDVTSTGDEIIIHSFAEKDPLPVTLFHQPVCVSFTTFENGTTVMDPSYTEERLGVTQLTLGLNAYRELCCLHFDHTTISKVSTDVLSLVMKDAINYATNLVRQIKETVRIDVEARYKKEAAKAFRFKNIIATDKITSMMTERIQIRLSKWHSSNKHKEEVEDPSDIEMKDDEESEDEEETEDTEIVRVGEGSAELITNSNPTVGEGGKNTWDSSDEEEMEDDDSDEIELIKIQKQEKKVLDNIELSDSEEETTCTVSTSDLL